MCGIAGFFLNEGRASRYRLHLTEALACLRDRGPDGEGVWIDTDSGFGLGHTLLAIQGEAEQSIQPIVNEEAGVALVFNGEIYNYRDLYDELRSIGKTFRVNTDADVLLEAYLTWGVKCVEKFVGMYAFAIADKRKKMLGLCRDPIGVKPLHYVFLGDEILFASEIRALRAFPDVCRDIDGDALGEYLQYGYIAAPRTIFKGVQKLLPGRWLWVGRNGVKRIEPYWKLEKLTCEEMGTPAGGEEQEAAAVMELGRRARAAVRRRLVSRAPVGLMLSGGIDSTLVAVAARELRTALPSFTASFPDAAADESRQAERIARKCGFEHHVVPIGMREAQGVLERWGEIFDEPFADHSGIPTYLVAKYAREHVKVLLTGDGGDELFGGYASYRALARRLWIRRAIPNQVGWTVGQVMKYAAFVGDSVALALGQLVAEDRGPVFAQGRLLRKAAEFLRGSAGVDCLRPFRSVLLPGEVSGLLGRPYKDPRYGRIRPEGSRIGVVTEWDLREYLPDCVLCKADRATMRAGVEAREPLLDGELIAFAFGLPDEWRVGNLGNKHLVRRYLNQAIGPEFVMQDKRGFVGPIEAWLNCYLS
ncbi:MAG: asparagine synthase (glutamine-hydrolyzing), partial [candidate division WOR-3 bacterium]